MTTDKTMQLVEEFTMKYALSLPIEERKLFVRELGQIAITAAQEAMNYVVKGPQ